MTKKCNGEFLIENDLIPSSSKMNRSHEKMFHAIKQNFKEHWKNLRTLISSVSIKSLNTLTILTFLICKETFGYYKTLQNSALFWF